MVFYFDMHPGGPGHEPLRIREIWPPGTLIKGDYVVEKKIGSGGFGSVYLARHRFLGSMHVIKRLHEQYASDEEFVRKFMNEGRAVRKLKNCPHVVAVEHMTQSEDGHLILVMEHVAGGDLDALMQARPMTVAEVIESGRQIALGLEAAHRAGLIHRDIKPQNVLIGEDSAGRPVLKIIDFGLAKDHGAKEQTSVMRGGSVGYTAPEQWLKAGKDIDGRADLYSLGASMYKMLCGHMPYDSADDVMPWMARVAQGPPPAPATIRRDCPAALSALILEMLAAEPAGRPADAGVVVRRLTAMTGAAGVERKVMVPVAVETPRVQAVVLEAAPVGAKGRKAGWAGGGVGGFVALGVVMWFATRPAPTPAPVVEPPKQVAPKEEVPRAQREKAALETGVRESRGAEVKKQVEQTAGKKAAAVPAAGSVTAQPPESKGKPVEAVKPAAPALDHLALGDAARNGGDLGAALRHYREAGDAGRLAALQKAVEGDAEERAGGFMDRGLFGEALKVAERWLGEFPGSQRLTRLRARVVRARDSQ